MDALSPTLSADPRRIDALLRRDDVTYYIDVTPLLDAHWTGIPMVAARLADRFLRAAPDRTEFFFEGRHVHRPLVEAALKANGGAGLAERMWNGGSDLLALYGDRLSVGIYPSVKRVRGYFDIETSIVHDLSTMITPEFHTAENVDYHMQRLVPDIQTNDVTFCVSDATRLDLLAYFGDALGPVLTMYNGVEWPEDFARRYGAEIGDRKIERFAVILGTREPRKNIAKVFEMLDQFPAILDELRFVFVGKTGWLQEKTEIPQVLADAEAAGRIVFTGYVSEYEKYKLLRAAWITLYPSLFEGFGLPVVESLSVGTPCLASFSSSLPEVGGKVTPYFDPLSAADLHGKLRALARTSASDWAGLREEARRAAARFTWDASFESLMAGLAPVIEAQLGAGGTEIDGDWQ